jgi:hypothetical protein
MGLLSRAANRVHVRPNEADVDAVLKLIGKGARKNVYEDASDPAHVFVDMYPHAATEEFFRFARQAHRDGLPIARHFPNPEEMAPRKKGGDIPDFSGEAQRVNPMRFRAERLAENEQPVRIGMDEERFYLNGLAKDDPQHESLLAAANAMKAHLDARLPRPGYFYDMNKQNFMRRPDGTLVINDPVAAIALMLGGGAVGGGLLSRTKHRAAA